MISINRRLKAIHLNCRIRLVEKRVWQYAFEFVDVRRERVIGDIGGLSAGQKAIVHLVLEAYGRGDLKGGVIVIDEPEIHLHYQLQHEYLQVIFELNQTQKSQYILVTHSEALISSGTISSVRRLALSDAGNTMVFSPELTADEKTLVRILDNTRSTYAFFSRKVVLVEGETDRYFLRAIIQYYFKDFEQDISVLHIGGKGEFAKWRSLFQSFGLKVYSIADFDFVKDLHFPTERSAALQAEEQINAFKSRNPEWKAKIHQEAIRSNFILMHGNLESYLGVRKDLAVVIKWCRHNLRTFMEDTSSVKSTEWRMIVRSLVT